MKVSNFIIFFSIVILIYGSLNYYIFIRGWQAIPQHSNLKIYYLFLFLPIALTFFAGRILERFIPSAFTDVLVWIGSFWLGAMLYFFLIIVLLDFVRLINNSIQFYPAFATFNYEKTKFVVLIFSVIIVTSLLSFGYLNAKNPVINKLNLKRKCKGDNYLHKASKIIINELIKNNINTLIIGKNNYWKNESRLNKTNNQNFVQIPHSRFIDMLKYKCERRGINVMCREESYTSKASFLNLDYIPSYKKNDKTVYVFSGYREHRGIYKIKNSNIKINSDVNGAYNILRKAIPNAFANGIEGIGVYPEIINILK